MVVVKDAEPDTMKGLFLPFKSRPKPTSGVIVAVGPEAPVQKIGKRVVFGQHAGISILVDGHPFLVLDYEEILAMLPAEVPLASA